jgi:LuxR family transcriptional activator of conjugal transfer of Ti plasmids
MAGGRLADFTDDLAPGAFEIAEALSKCATVQDVSDLFCEAVSQLNMTTVACGMVSGSHAIGPTPFHFMNWPADWMAIYQARHYAKIDPIPRWAIISGKAASWSEIMAALPPKDAGQEVYREVIRYGYREGFVTPVRTADGDLGLVSVCGDRGPLLPDEKLFLQTVSIAALHRANSLMVPPREVSGSTLSTREKECVMLLGQGLTDREISRVLNVSGATVRFHLDNARHKMGARSRAHLTMMLSSRPD